MLIDISLPVNIVGLMLFFFFALVGVVGPEKTLAFQGRTIKMKFIHHLERAKSAKKGFWIAT